MGGRVLSLSLGMLMVWLVGCAGEPLTRDWGAVSGDLLRGGIRGGMRDPWILVAGERRAVSPALSRFYLKRGDRPAWCSPRGPRGQADDLLEALRKMEGDGLNLQDYHLGIIERKMGEWRGVERAKQGLSMRGLVELDLLLTDAFLSCGGHLQRGRVFPQQIHPEWQARIVSADLAGLLQTALDLNQVGRALLGLRPPQPGYAFLRRALGEYRQMVVRGGWGSVKGARSLRRGSKGGSVERLSRRLVEMGDLSPDGGGRRQFDQPMELGLMRFQERHGLEVTGRVDSATWRALGVPLEERIAQIELNMERWRWLPHDPGTRYILVRIADFELDVVENGESVIEMRVIVGKPYWRTPVFSSKMTHLEFNPSWYIPRSIAVEEVLPKVRLDSTYLEQRNILVAVGGGDTARVVSADSIDWQGIVDEEFDFLFTQLPGPGNPLGRVKFFFPNPFDVYLHDTPNSALFEQRFRDFSHGCIRLEKSLELAAYALGKNWELGRVEEAVGAGENRGVLLPDPLPVYLLYWTAWGEEGGMLQFREDAYDDDRRLMEALVGNGGGEGNVGN
ncbi:MAG: L,D-transpeptidase family protein [Gemmatimonadetes bacterium]|nr:L,D-transpeptidase family protein [Gemmatimonadota bacterium]